MVTPNRKIFIEMLSGERFEADIPLDAMIGTLATEFFEAQGWPIRADQHLVVELLNPEDPEAGILLDQNLEMSQSGVREGDTLRISPQLLTEKQQIPSQHQPSHHLKNVSISMYIDFDITIGPAFENAYSISARSLVVECHRRTPFPFDARTLERYTDKLQIALLRSGGQRRHVLLPEEKAVQEFGQKMFEMLFAGETASRYQVCQMEASHQGKGVRIRLHIEAPEMVALPWEFMYDSGQGEYLCLSRNTPLVRYLDLPQPIPTLGIQPPLQVLGLIAVPSNLPALEIEHEKNRVETALADLQKRKFVEVTWLEGATWRDLQRAMRGGPWHIFHFIGHGYFDDTAGEGVIALCKEDGSMDPLFASQLGHLLTDHRTLRLVLLNACESAQGNQQDIFSSTAATIVRRGLPAVVAMQYHITDQASIEFSRTFYESLADGLPVDAAVAEARKAISMTVNNTLEWGTPVLYMRSPDGAMFDLDPLAPTNYSG